MSDTPIYSQLAKNRQELLFELPLRGERFKRGEVMEPTLIVWYSESVLKFTKDKWAGKACPAEALAKEETAQPYHRGRFALSPSSSFAKAMEDTSYFPGVGRVSPLTAHFSHRHDLCPEIKTPSFFLFFAF